jgi:hypothetical protein
LPLTHNHHAPVKHALNGGFQQRVSHGVFHNIERITQLPANQSQAAAFIKVPVDILRLLGSKKHRAPSAGGAWGVRDRDQNSLRRQVTSFIGAYNRSRPI